MAAAVASEVPSWIAESLRALEARLAAAEKGTAAAAMVSTARLGRESDETDAVERGGASAKDAPFRSTPNDSVNVPKRGNEPSSKRCAPVWKRLRRWRFPPRRRRRARRSGRRRREPSARGRKKRRISKGPFSPKKSKRGGEVRRSEVSGSAANAEHVAFAAVESSKHATEKLDELSGTVAELAEALEAARRELRESEKRKTKNAEKLQRAKTPEADARREAAFESGSPT